MICLPYYHFLVGVNETSLHIHHSTHCLYKKTHFEVITDLVEEKYIHTSDI